ncbi:hypothetical protein WI75_08670 [Burkholderia ubonensis]|nr:hypothetical protein WI75_08670 [Burkholderia ubonensis]
MGRNRIGDAAEALSFIRSHPGCAREEIGQELGWSKSTTLRAIEELGKQVKRKGYRYTAVVESRTIREQAEPADPAIALLIRTMNLMITARVEA